MSASVDNTLLDLLNSSYPTQPHSLIAKLGDFPQRWSFVYLSILQKPRFVTSSHFVITIYCFVALINIILLLKKVKI